MERRSLCSGTVSAFRRVPLGRSVRTGCECIARDCNCPLSSASPSPGHESSMRDSNSTPVLQPVLSASPGCRLHAKRSGSIAAAAAAACGEAGSRLLARTSLFPLHSSLMRRGLGVGEASRLDRCARHCSYPLTLRNAAEDNRESLSDAECFNLIAVSKNAAASPMAAGSSPYASSLGQRLRKGGCSAKRVKSSTSFLDAFQHALDEAAAQASLERAGRDDAERKLEQLQEDLREKRQETSILQQQVSSLQRRCDTLAAQQRQQAAEAALLRQHQTAKRVEASLLREEVHDNSRKAETLLSQLDEAQQQLRVSRATLTKREMENGALVEQLGAHRDKCALFEEELARLAKHMQADKEVTGRLKERLHAFLRAEKATGASELHCFDDIHSACRPRMCGLQRQAAAERAAVMELLLKKKNIKLALKAQGLQDKLEACENEGVKDKAAVVRLQEALDVERVKSSEALQRELVLRQQLAQQQQQHEHQQRQEEALLHLEQEKAFRSLSKKLGEADVEVGRLQAEIRKKDALMAKLTEEEAQLQQQLCEGTRAIEQQSAMNTRQEEENKRLTEKTEDQNRRLRQQQLEQDASRAEHEREMQQLTNRLQERSAMLCEAKREALAKEEQLQLLLQEVQQLRDVRAASDALQERCQTSSRLLGIYKIENQRHERRCETLVKEVQLASKRVSMLQEELDSKAKCLKEAREAEEAMKLDLQQARDDQSAAEGKVSYLEREKEELLLNWERQWQCQRQHTDALQAQRQQQFEEELKLLKEEIEQRRLQHLEDIAVLERKLSEQTKKALMLQTELDQKVAQILRLQAPLDELEARAELLRDEKRALEEAEKQLHLARQKCRLHEKDKSKLSERCELLETEVRRLNRALLEAAESAHRCEELQQEKFHLQETLQEVERDLRVKDEEISNLTRNQKEMQKQMQDERANIEAMVPKLIEMQVKNKVCVLQQKFQQKMAKLKRKLADRSQYEDKVREVMQAELQSLQRWNQEMEKWELLTSSTETNPCGFSTNGCPAELLCCHK